MPAESGNAKKENLHQSAGECDLSSQRFLAFARERDAEALEILLREHIDKAYSQAAWIVGNQSDAEDAVQDALVELVRTADRYDGSVPFAAWLTRLIRSTSITLYRSRTKRRIRETLVGTTVSNPQRADGDSNIDLVRREMAELPEHDRCPLDLHYFGGLSIEETASALGLSAVATTKRIHRAREKLQERLRQRGIQVSSALILASLVPAPAQAAPPALIAAALHTAATPIAAAALSVPAIAAISALIVLGGVGTSIIAPRIAAPQSSAGALESVAGMTGTHGNQTNQPIIVGSPIDMSTARADSGFCYIADLNSGEPDKSAGTPISRLMLFENGTKLGPAHATHADVRSLGHGRFSHWRTTKVDESCLYFSATDNSDPRTNGRTYTYRIEVDVVP